MHFVFILLLFTASAVANSQEQFGYDPQAEARFQEGLNRLSAGDTATAGRAFHELTRHTRIHQRSTAAYILSAILGLRQDDPGAARLMIGEFLDRFPQSSYVVDAIVILALADLSEGDKLSATRKLLRSTDLETGSESMLDTRALLDSIIDHRLSVAALRELKLEEWGEKGLARIALAQMNRMVERGAYREAREYLETLPESAKAFYSKEIASLRIKLSRGISFTIGVLIPLTKNGEATSTSLLAGEVLQGIEFAVEEYRMHVDSLRIELDVRDTEKDSASAVTQFNELVSDQNVICVLGPLFSAAVAAVSPQAEAQRVPVISPTATANGLTEGNRYTYQANPDFTARGKSMARYAVRQLGFSRLGIISTTDPGSRLVADAFSAEVELLGGCIVADETYPSGADDLRESFLSIRAAALTDDPHLCFPEKLTKQGAQFLINAGASQSAVDSIALLGGYISMRKLFGGDWNPYRDSLRLSVVLPDTGAENLDVAISSLDGVFSAIGSPEEISSVGSQLTFFNIRTQLLGSNEWYNLPELDANRRYVNGSIFVADSYLDYEDTTVISFDQRFKSMMRDSPTRYTLYGYDAMRVVLDQLHRGARSRDELSTALSALTEYEGIHSNISFGLRRVNPHLHILQYAAGMILKIGEESGD